MTFKWPWKVTQGQRSWRNLTKSAMKNIFCYWHLWPTDNGFAAIGDFHFRDLEMTLQKVIQGQGHCGFWILATKFLLVSPSNNGSISHRLGATGHVRDLERSHKANSQGAIRQTRTWWTILSTGTHRLEASVYMPWVILTFVTLKWPWKVNRGQRSWRSLTQSAMGNIFCYWHLWPTGNGLAATGDFHFRDLENVCMYICMYV